MVSLSMRRPSDEIGRTFNHAPDSPEVDASRRVRVLGLVAFSKRVSAVQDALRLTGSVDCIQAGSSPSSKVDISDATHNALEQVVIFLESGRQETG